MPLLSREDLEYDYSWNNRPERQQDPKEKGPVDKDMFDREEGDDVLKAINDYARKRKITNKKKGLEIERKLHENMSRDITTQRGLTDWLDSIFGDKEEDEE